MDTCEVMPFAEVPGERLYPLSHYILTRTLSGVSDQPLPLFSSLLLTPFSLPLIHVHMYVHMHTCTCMIRSVLEGYLSLFFFKKVTNYRGGKAVLTVLRVT